MKNYFCKYLPVGEKVVPGDWMKIHCTGKVVQCTGFDGPKPSYNNDRCVTRPGDHTRVKLFLCSRDIQVGDKVIDSIDGKEYEVKSGFLPPEMVKVIGEISSEATWVKEGDEFDEIRYECLSINAFGEGTSHVFTEDQFKKRDIKPYPRTNSLCAPRGIWFLSIMVKGPCGHFH